MYGYYIMLGLHVLGACVWVGGHFVLATSILPRALKERRASVVLDFERGYERVGMPALVIQIITGLWLAHRILGSPSAWFTSNGIARVVQLKLTLLFATALLAIHAKWRVIPKLTDATLPILAAHILAVTLLAISFVLAGASIRLGGFPFFQP